MNEQITEEFANELLSYVVVKRLYPLLSYVVASGLYPREDSLQELRIDCQKDTLKALKKAGYIKQSREEEIREELKQLVPKVIIDSRDVICDVDYDTWEAYELQKELIEILDKKLEGK
jgi:hypothetical protein